MRKFKRGLNETADSIGIGHYSDVLTSSSADVNDDARLLREFSEDNQKMKTKVGLQHLHFDLKIC